jgi:predicted nucleotide-binding protein
MRQQKMETAIASRLAKLAAEGAESSHVAEMERWAKKVTAFLQAAGLSREADKFVTLRAEDDFSEHALRLGHLEGLLARAEAKALAPAGASTPASAVTAVPPNLESRKVFVVHGHDNETKEATARFIERIGLEPIILHEQASSGRTIIEKFEIYSGDIAFAVVLLTPDDVGAANDATPNLNPRARQNVILELGYFMGRLGRVRVCALHKGGVELPSDYQGVIYIEMDPSGAWKSKLAQELVQAKLPIDLNGLLGA